MNSLEQYHENFITAAYRVMGELRLNQSGFAEWLSVGRVTVYKIMERKQAPTVQQGIDLCLKADVDANWLFLNKGAMEPLNLVPGKGSRKKDAPTAANAR